MAAIGTVSRRGVVWIVLRAQKTGEVLVVGDERRDAC